MVGIGKKRSQQRAVWKWPKAYLNLACFGGEQGRVVILVCLGLRDFLGGGAPSFKTGTVLGKPR